MHVDDPTRTEGKGNDSLRAHLRDKKERKISRRRTLKRSTVPVIATQRNVRDLQADSNFALPKESNNNTTTDVKQGRISVATCYKMLLVS